MLQHYGILGVQRRFKITAFAAELLRKSRAGHTREASQMLLSRSLWLDDTVADADQKHQRLFRKRSIS